MALVVNLPGNIPCKVVKWKVKKGSRITQASVLALYKHAESENIHKLKCNHFGTVTELVVSEGQTVEPGCVLLRLEGCQHPTVMKDMCAECGADLREEHGTAGDRKSTTSASVAMVHSIPELIVSEKLALEIGKQDEKRLLNNRKLVLLVDLDQTLLHTTNDNIPANLKDVDHFRLWHGKWMWYHTKFRPNYRDFLDKMSKYFELHICTFGVRMYAHTIARFLDPEGKYFSHRILSRDECFSSNSKTANLKALFPCGDSMVCIIDDRDDVWKFAPNLVHVKPYLFFDGTADINAPPGLATKSKDKTAKAPRHNVKVIKVPRNRPKTAQNQGEMETGQDGTQTNNNHVHKAESMDTDHQEIQGDKKDDTGTDGEKVQQESEMETETKSGTEMVAEQESDNSNCESMGFSAVDTELTNQPHTSEGEQNSTTKEDTNYTQAPQSKQEVTSEQEVASEQSCSSNLIADKDLEPETTKEDTSEVVSDSKDSEVFSAADGDSTKCTGTTQAREDGSVSSQQMAGTSESAEHETGLTPDEDVPRSGLEDFEVSDDSSDCSESNETNQEGVPTSTLSDSVKTSCEDDETGISHEDRTAEASSGNTDGTSVQPVTSPDGTTSTTTPDGTTSTVVPSEKEDGEVTSEEDRDAAADSQRADAQLSVEEEYDEVVEWEDTDDYLHYLEDILTRIHKAYYEMYDQSTDAKSSKIPDLKSIIPYVKKKVLRGARILFSGVIPTNQVPEKSRAYNLAKSFGANVHSVFVPRTEKNKSEATTHVVAAKTGTQKVHQARKHKTVKIVNPDWLWTCCQRWEWVDERLFPLSDQSSYPYADSPEPRKSLKKAKDKKSKQVNDEVNDSSTDTKLPGEQTTSDDTAATAAAKPAERRERRFSDSYNPLFAFSSSDIKQMDQEVEEIFDESESEDSESELRRIVLGYNKKRPRESSSEDESLTSEYPKGWGKKHSKRNKATCENTDNNLTEDDMDDENEEMRKIIEDPNRVLKLSDQSSESRSSFNESIGSVDEEMAEALEKEFLSYL